MPHSALLASGLGELGLGLAMFVVAAVPARQRRTGVGRALATIERHYMNDLRAAGPAARPVTALPGWPRRLALRVSPSGVTASLQRRLDLAGNPPRWDVDRVLAVKGLGMLGLALLGGLYGLHHPAAALLYAILGAAIGLYLPDVLLYNTGVKRQARIQASLPDALDMLTVCVEAGLGFDAALSKVALNTEGPLAAEFTRVLQEMQIGKSRSDALRAMTQRTTVTELRAFAAALLQASELGIAVAQVLREQAREMRSRRRQRAEEKAQKVPVKILFPLIACLFPALFVIIIGPGAITIMQSLFSR